MGIETAIIIGLTAASIAANNSQARKKAKAVTREGQQQAEAKARDVRRTASAAKVSFLNSGLEMEGTPELSIMGILDAGQQDINTIKGNADSKSKQIIGAARAKAIASIASAGTSLYTGGAFSGMGGSTAGMTTASTPALSPTGNQQFGDIFRANGLSTIDKIY